MSDLELTRGAWIQRFALAVLEQWPSECTSWDKMDPELAVEIGIAAYPLRGSRSPELFAEQEVTFVRAMRGRFRQQDHARTPPRCGRR